jgi:hypothetical protein
MKPRPTLLFLVALATGAASPVYAQLAGEHALPAFGLKAATQPPPGAFLAPTWFHWNVNSIVGRDGGEVPIDLQVNSLALFAWVVTPKKLLGGTYGFQAVVPLVSNALELPRLGYENSTSLGLGDIYLMPVNLGWHTPRADFIAGLALYFPTGTYEPGGSANRGMGMWTFEISGGSTLYFDRGQKWHLSALAFYEVHTSKEDQDLTPGSILSIEGGLGGTFLKGALSAGLAYGAQWKMTDDSGDDFPPSVLPGRNHIYTLGPEVSFTGFYKPPWLISLTARYLWDVGASSGFEGSRFIVFATVGRLHLPGAGTTAP